MSDCDQEMCAFWSGDGCACAVFQISAEEREAENRRIRLWLGDDVAGQAVNEGETK